MIINEEISIKTRGNYHVIDITDHVTEQLSRSKLSNGCVVLFHVGSTAGLTTVEYEPGLANHDLAAAFEKIAPQRGTYQHEQTWHDDNGHAHIRATLLGPSLTVPFRDGRLTLGTWQQIILIDFDTRARTRDIICQITGE